MSDVAPYNHNAKTAAELRRELGDDIGSPLHADRHRCLPGPELDPEDDDGF